MLRPGPRCVGIDLNHRGEAASTVWRDGRQEVSMIGNGWLQIAIFGAIERLVYRCNAPATRCQRRAFRTVTVPPSCFTGDQGFESGFLQRRVSCPDRRHR
jgi:hypothetical protein